MKVALVHDHLAQDGGAEATLKVLAEIYLEAPIFVVIHDKKRANKFFLTKDIRTSFLQKVPLGVRKYQWFFSLMPQAVESYDLSEFDLVISSSSSFAKGVLTRPQTLHICYCHTPTRFLWSDTHSYVRELKVNRFLRRIIPLLLTNIRLWDKTAAERVSHFIANSWVVAERIKKYYNRESEVIYPPVEIDKFKISQPEDYWLAGGRLVPYKRFDLIIEAFNRLGRPLKIFGSGPELEKLKAMAKPNIEFLGRISEEEKIDLYSRALAFLNPQEEDFGITMIEAMASGRPVIAWKKGGATEIVTHQTGVFFEQQTWEDLADAVLQFKPEEFDSLIIRRHAEQFDVKNFQQRIKDFVNNKLKLWNYANIG